MKNLDSTNRGWATGYIHEIIEEEHKGKIFYKYVLRVNPMRDGGDPSFVLFKLSKQISPLYEDKIEKGDKVYITYMLFAKEYKERWYQDVVAISIVFEDAKRTSLSPDEEGTPGDDDLPF